MYSARSKYWFLLAICLLGAGAARAQSITLVSGNGQLLDTTTHSQSLPLVVLVRDANSNPVKGATVNWSVAPTGRGALQATQTTTDSTGKTQIFFTTAGSVGGNSFVQSLVTATGGGGSVQFTLTTVENNGVEDFDQIILSQPTSRGELLVGQAGEQDPGAVQVQVVGANGGTEQGEGINNVSVSVLQDDPNDASTIGCAAGSVIYTSETGIATCNLAFGGKIGTGTFSIIIGGIYEFSGYNYQVKAGPPAEFINLMGNNQSGNPGQELPVFLQGTLTDLGGNPVPNTPVTFTSVPANAVTFTRPSTTTDALGDAGAFVTLGNGAGPVQVQLAAGSVVATFHLTINVTVTGLNIVSGNSQSALEDTSFASPLIVEVFDGTTPVPGVTVNFAVTSGSAILGNSSVTTGANGQASTAVTAGPTPGPVVITASASGTNSTTPFTQTFNLTVTPPGPVCSSVLQNGASFAPNAISPGGVAVIYCQSGVADGLTGVATGGFGTEFFGLPTTVQNVSIEFGEATSGPWAPIFYVANINGQQSVAIQVPFELYPLSGTTIPMILHSSTGTVTLTVTIQQGAPGIFEYTLPDGVTRNAIMLHANGSQVTPANPAIPGETLRAYVTGLIPPFTNTGASTVSSNLYLPLTGEVTITTPVIVGVNHAGIAPPTVTYAYGMAGVWEVEFVVPTGTAANASAAFDIGIPVNGQTVLAKGSLFPIGSSQ